MPERSFQQNEMKKRDVNHVTADLVHIFDVTCFERQESTA